jgi:hypothetical protein
MEMSWSPQTTQNFDTLCKKKRIDLTLKMSKTTHP